MKVAGATCCSSAANTSQPSRNALQISLVTFGCCDKLLPHSKYQSWNIVFCTHKFRVHNRNKVVEMQLSVESWGSASRYSRVRQPDRTPSINSGRSLCNLTRLPKLSSLGCPYQLQINLLASAAHWAQSLEPVFRTSALFAVAPVPKSRLAKLSGKST
jgi:hypothetical protein